MSAETLIERVARAIYMADYSDVPEAAAWWDLPMEDPEGFTHASWLTNAAAALAALADAPGLEEALAAHRITSGYDWNEESYSFCSCGLEGAGAAHLADVVRAWLR